MAIVSGHGGTTVVGGTTFHNTNWELNKKARIAECTNSGSGGFPTYLSVLTEGTATVDFCWDSDNIPDTDIDFDVGDTTTLRLNIGTTGSFYTMPVIVEDLVITNPQQFDLVKGRIMCRINGAVTNPT